MLHNKRDSGCAHCDAVGEIKTWIESASPSDGKPTKTNWLGIVYLTATFVALVSILLFLFSVLWPHGPGISPVGPYIPNNP